MMEEKDYFSDAATSSPSCLTFILAFVGMVVFIVISLFALTSCTISFQNISTEGTASDLVDTDQDASPDVKTDLSIPLS